MLLSLPLIGLAQAMIYRNNYLVPTFPHMITCASEDYGYANDDILSDAISGLSNMACNIGEIFGPIFAGTLIDIIGFETTGAIVGFSCFLYGIVYLFGSGLLGKWLLPKKLYSISTKMISPEEKLTKSNIDSD